jgi:hypothetical protein
MHRNMLQSAVYAALFTGLAAALTACSGGGGGGSSGSLGSPQSNTQVVPVPLTLSDASSDDWATIGVKVLSIALVPQGGGSNVTVWTAPTPAPCVNLEQLDQLGEILGNVSVPVGTYTAVVLTISANPGDVLLTVSENPESGFPVAAGSSIPGNQIQIQGAQGSSGSLTVPVTVNLVSPLVVSTAQTNALDLEFDLAHPAFIVAHTPPAAMGATLWAVNFAGPVRHHPIYDITRLVLRHSYGTVQSVANDDSSFTMSKDFPVLPVTNPETAVASAQSLTIEAYSSGTIFYDLDAQTRTVVDNFSTEAPTLVGKYVRVAARYQQDGTLVAVRVWASSDFNKVWVSPEGHVTHVDVANDLISVANESGTSTPVLVTANTQVFFRQPWNAMADATPISTNGTTFLADEDLVRGFKVHVSVVDPLATPMVAQTIDIERAVYAGSISNANDTGFTYTRDFARVTDDYSINLDYMSAMTSNGTEAANGFSWWYFTFPTLATTGSAAIGDFVAATDGAVNFGGSVGALSAFGASTATWADPANASGWALRDAVLMPSPVPLGTITTPFSGNTFAMSAPGGTMSATVNVSTTPQSATLAYQVDRSNGVVTVTSLDLTSSTGLATFTAGMAANVPVKVYGVPVSDGSLNAYVVTYFTGTLPNL